MHVEKVEIYSDATNRAIMRHPGRKFPGVLLQGDVIYVICQDLDEICAKIRPQIDMEVYVRLNKVRSRLQHCLSHYKSVLQEHGVQLPFSDQP